ncbi:MAG: hypothetical protein JSR58_06945 [Verrucomicrobia bacterium]|nr:hypothetical protein [Verrucomicrobiota bacterium]
MKKLLFFVSIFLVPYIHADVIFTFQSLLKSGKIQMIDVSDLTNSEMYTLKETSSLLHIIKCPKGTQMPVTFSIENAIISVDPQAAECVIKANEDMYLVLLENDHLYSLDMQNWFQMSKSFIGSITHIWMKPVDKGLKGSVTLSYQ